MTATLTEQPLQTTNGNHLAPTQGPETGPREHTVTSYAWAASRISIGFVFLWAFLDKAFALGYATGTDHTTGAIDGAALMLGIGMRVAAASGALLLTFMSMASLPLDNDPFMNDHLIYAVVLIGLAAVHAGDTLGLGRTWARTDLVRRFPVLR